MQAERDSPSLPQAEQLVEDVISAKRTFSSCRVLLRVCRRATGGGDPRFDEEVQ